MEMIDKYIYAIGQKLPLKSRNEIKKELASLILDDIEAKYGKKPTDMQINSAITEFGTPGKVAKRYSGAIYVIESGFTDIYYMIMKIMVGAVSVAFFTVFAVSLFTENLGGYGIFRELLKVPLHVIQASISGIGVLTLIFIIVSKFMKDREIDLEEDWSVKDLESINLSDEVESKIESIIAIILIPIFIALINIYPDVMILFENLFEKSGLTLGNRINMELFRNYILIFSGLGLLQILYHVQLLRKENKSKGLYRLDTFISLFNTVFVIIILKQGDLFIYNDINRGLFTTSTIGFKVMILIGLIIGIAELMSKLIKYIRIEIIEKKFSN